MIRKSWIVFAVAMLTLCVLTATASSDIKRCKKIAWSPEIVTFYGDAETILDKLHGVDGDIDNRRVFAFVVESNNGSRLGLFERQSADQMTLGSIDKTSFGDLTADLTDALLANRGEYCAGEITMKMLDSQSLTEGIEYASLQQAPNDLAAAFQALGLSGDEYLRVTIALLC